MGALCCHGNQSSNPISKKNLYKYSRSPNYMMIYMKFDKNWPTDIEIYTSFENVDRQQMDNDHRPIGILIPHFSLWLS